MKLTSIPPDAPMKLQRRYVLNTMGRISKKPITFGQPYTANTVGMMPNISPLTIDFDIDRQLFASANVGTFTIYNLGKEHRSDIFHDRTDLNPAHYMPINFSAGYVSEPTLFRIFKGNIVTAYSQKSPPDWKTKMEAYDGGYDIQTAQSEYSQTASGPKTLQPLLEKILKSGTGMKHVTIGYISPTTLKSLRGRVAAGSTWQNIVDICKGLNLYCFIDDEKLYVLDENGFLARGGKPKEITSQTGLIGTPVRYGNHMDVNLIFDPSVNVGQLCTVNCSEEYCNGSNWRIQGIHHRGRISPVSCGEATTRLVLWKKDS